MKNLATKILGIEELDSAPKLPGIYSWFARPDLDEASWERRPGQSEMEATGELISEIADFMTRCKPQPLQASVKTYFNASWIGTLPYTPPKNQGGVPAEKTKKTCSSDKERQVLSNLLLASFPLFWQPLYIGVAKNLRERLNNHQRAYKDCRDGIMNEGDFAEDDEPGLRILAQRLTELRIQPEEIRISILPIDYSLLGINVDQARSIAEAAESWLNRLNLPILGRK